jgi:NADH-quinone oxidoreductase subunit M
MIMTLASIGLPGLSGFVGEFLVLLGSFDAYRTWGNLPTLFPHPKLLTAIATTGVILSAVYMLYLFQKVMFGPLSNSRNRGLPDLSMREVAVFVPMVVMALWLGIYPSTFLSDIDPAVQRTVAFTQGKAQIAVEEGAPPKLVAGPAAPSPQGQQLPGAPPPQGAPPSAPPPPSLIMPPTAPLPPSGAQGNP